MRLLSLVCAAVVLVPAAVLAQERSLNFALGGGVVAAPEYFGSDNTEAEFDPSFIFGSLKFGPLDFGNGVRGVPDNGLSFGGAFRVVGDRTSEDSPELAGLEDIDTAIEIGFGLTLQQTDWRAFGEIRKGVTGHSGLTGTLGADLILRPNDRWVLSAGPRVNFGDDDFATTYFGVEEGTTSGFGAFDAGGGALGAGLEVAGTYYIDDKWALEGGLSYERLLGDAADSPITQNGSDDQWRVRVGISRVFNLNF